MTDDNRGWRANVYGEDMVSDGIRVVIGVRGSEVNRYVTAIRNGSPEMATVEHGAYPPEPTTLILPTDMARALLDALAVHFGGTGTARELRADYNHERGRVDKLITTLSTIAERP